MKKILPIALVILLGASIVGCGEKKATGSLKPLIDKTEVAKVEIQDKAAAQAQLDGLIVDLTTEEQEALKAELNGATTKEAREVVVSKAQSAYNQKQEAAAQSQQQSNQNNVANNSGSYNSSSNYSSGGARADSGSSNSATVTNSGNYSTSVDIGDPTSTTQLGHNRISNGYNSFDWPSEWDD